ncbi:MAG: ATP-binding protein [Legionella sp.]|nr:ATP-binding protein [Legionella sp.]
MGQQEKILKFWRDVEIFTIPKAPSKRDQDERTKIWELTPGMHLPWSFDHPAPCHDDENNYWVHSVFIGVSSTQKLTKATLSTLLPSATTTVSDLEKCGNDTGCFAMFAVNGAGQPITDSYVLASYILGIDQLRQGKRLEGISSLLNAERESFNMRRHAVAIECLKEEDKKFISPISWLELEEEVMRLLRLLGEHFADLSLQYLIKSIIKRRPKKKKTSVTTIDVDFLNSFYLNDLDMLITHSSAGKNFGKAFDMYIGDALPPNMRTDILQDTDAFSALLDPSRIPAGRWPIASNQHLMLAQQAAVYEAIHNLSEAHGIIGINGPPGTGKTTLLRDITADILVQRAGKIAQLNNPSDIFVHNSKDVKVDARHIYPLKKEIVEQSGIVVASNNNAAVENITKELPDRDNLAPEFNEVHYFSDLATKIHCERNGKATAWGLIAAVLGNACNKRRFMQHFFQEDIWWDLHFYDSLFKCKLNQLNGSTIILIGILPNLIAYLVQDKKFINDKNKNPIVVKHILSESTESIFVGMKQGKIICTDDNKTQLRIIIAQVVSSAVFLIEESDPDVDALSFIGQIDSLKQILETCARQPEYWQKKWQDAKCDFLKKLNEFQRIRDNLLNYKIHIGQYEKEAQAIIDAQRDYKQAKIALKQHHKSSLMDTLIQEQQKAEASLQETIDTKQQCEAQAIATSEYLQLAEQRDRPSLWERLLHNSLGIKTQSYVLWLKNIDIARYSHATAHEKLSVAILNWQQEKINISKLHHRITGTKAEYDNRRRDMLHLAIILRKNIQNLKNKHAVIEKKLSEFSSIESLPDGRFWQRPAAELQLSTVWLNDEIDSLRSQIFIAAIHLHEMTIRSGAKYFIANMRATKAMLLSETKEPLNSELISTLWNAFFFVVPVVSTALASFSRLFQGVGQENIGWLLIDEAGQATPQSAAGAIWRARRAIIVGDPIQIEPVVTVPAALVTKLREEYQLDFMWSPLGESAQTLADRVTPLGTWMGAKSNDVQTWTGMPLRAHRRCASPMFDIANKIAYSGQMVQGNTKTSKIHTILGESSWFDVRSTSSDGQVVSEEIELFSHLLQIVKNDWPKTETKEGKRLAKIYAISPFSRVAKKCAFVASKLSLTKGERRIDCGTIHRFQGKEADIVFLILGSAPGRAGNGSRSWASQKPNLLNVALTRAKSCIYVIGNKSDWQSCANFNLLANTLPTSPLNYDSLISTHSLNKTLA